VRRRTTVRSSWKRVVPVGALALTLLAAAPSTAPLRVLLERSSVVTFVRLDDPSRYVGYRIVENEPIMTAEPVTGYDAMPRRKGDYPPPPLPAEALAESAIPRGEYSATWQGSFEDKTYFFRSGKDGTTYFRAAVPQGTRVSVFEPVADGLDAWMWLEPSAEIRGSYLVEQCLRMSGVGNTFKRRQSSFVPELSEYDLWDRGDMRGLSSVRQGNGWTRVPPLLAYAQQSEYKQAWEFISKTAGGKWTGDEFPTPPGLTVEQVRTRIPAGREQTPFGLIVRESVDGTTVAGMYWERAARVATHYPADCLHELVDLASAPAGKPPVVRGKIYWFKGNKDDLLAHWKKDFPG
jgi:hypothetical protein